MPALPPFAPWIKAPDETGNFATGYQMAAAAAAKQAALQQEDKRLMLDEHRMEIEKAYQDSQISIQRQQLDDERKKMDMAIKRAADQAAARLRIQQRIAAGEPYQKVYQEEGPAAFNTAAGLGPIFKPQPPPPQIQIMPPDPTKGFPGGVMDSKGGFKFNPNPKPQPTAEEKSDSAFNKDIVAKEMVAKLKALDADIEAAKNEKVRRSAIEQKTELLRKINERRNLYDRQYGVQRAPQATMTGTADTGGVVASYDPKTKTFVPNTPKATAPPQAAPGLAPVPAPAPALPPAPASIPPQILDPNKLHYTPPDVSERPDVTDAAREWIKKKIQSIEAAGEQEDIEKRLEEEGRRRARAEAMGEPYTD